MVFGYYLTVVELCELVKLRKIHRNGLVAALSCMHRQFCSTPHASLTQIQHGGAFWRFKETKLVRLFHLAFAYHWMVHSCRVVHIETFYSTFDRTTGLLELCKCHLRTQTQKHAAIRATDPGDFINLVDLSVFTTSTRHSEPV